MVFAVADNHDFPAHQLSQYAVEAGRVMAARWSWSRSDWQAYLGFLATMPPDQQRAGVAAAFEADTHQHGWRGLTP